MDEWQGRRVLVTGAAGFIGSHVAERLVGLGATVVGLDNFDPFYPREMKEANLRAIHQGLPLGQVGQVVGQGSGRGASGADGLHSAGSFKLVEGDLTDASVVIRAVEGCHSVIHLAAKAGVRPSIADPSGYAVANVVGTSVVLESARAAGVQRVVVASSSSVYGNASKVPFAEEDPASEPISPYAATKRACELLGHTYHHLSGVPVAMLRFFTVYGPRQRPDLGIRLFLERCARGETIRMFGDGSSSRDYTFVDDIVDGVLGAHEAVPAHGYRVWNLGGSNPVRLDALIECVGRTVGRPAVVEQVGLQQGDVDRTWADLRRSETEIGYKPSVGLEEGVARQWAWMQSLATC